jgi:hypothetical protein
MIESGEQDYHGRLVVSRAGERIGKVADLFSERDGAPPTFATVHTGLLGTRTSFVPLTEAELRGDEIVVPYSKDVVREAPSIEVGEELTFEEERRLFDHYAAAAPAAPPAPGPPPPVPPPGEAPDEPPAGGGLQQGDVLIEPGRRLRRYIVVATRPAAGGGEEVVLREDPPEQHPG